MKKLKLLRDFMDERVTLGVLSDPDPNRPSVLPPIYTLERPWRMNQRTISCIPPGTYIAKLDMYYGGDGVGGAKNDYPAYELQDVPDRSEIKIHIGNYVRNVVGCIAIGLVRDAEVPAVWNSAKAFSTFMDYMHGYPAFELEIAIAD